MVRNEHVFTHYLIMILKIVSKLIYILLIIYLLGGGGEEDLI